MNKANRRKFFLFCVGIVLFCPTLFAQNSRKASTNSNVNSAASREEKKSIVATFEDLPEETVTPLLDDPQAVRSKLVEVAKRWYLDLDCSFDLDEPFQNNIGFGGSTGYFFDDKQALGVRFQKLSSGLRDYGQQFASSSAQLQFSRPPFADYKLLFQYDLQALYGKVSFAKSQILPVSGRFGIWLGGGHYTDDRFLFSSGLFARASLFFNSNLAFAIMFRGMFEQIPNVLSSSIRLADPVIPASGFATRWDFSYHFDLGLTVLF